MEVSTQYPSLQKFLIESALYEHVGLNFETLKTRPLREGEDYIQIANLISIERVRQQRKSEAQSGKGQ
jgi:hypothetical protein